MTRALVPALAVVAVLVAGGPAAADNGNAARAGALFEQAQARYQAGEYRAAITLFMEAYELVRDPVYLFNLAQSYRKVLDCVAATDYYQRYLADASAGAERRDSVERWLRELAPCAEQRRREAEAAGREAARARAEDQRRREDAARPRFTEIDRGRGLRIAGYATGAAGALGLAAGVAYSIRGSSLRAELDERCGGGCRWTPELAAQDRAGARANTLAIAGWAGGGAALATAAVLYFVGRSRIERTRVVVEPAPAPGGVALSARLAF